MSRLVNAAIDISAGAEARVRGARSIYWVMDVYPDLAYELGVLPAGSLSGRLLDRVSRFLVRRSDRVIVLGETMAARLHGAREANPIVIHNWADGESIRPRPVTDSLLRREWNWGDRFVVLLLCPYCTGTSPVKETNRPFPECMSLATACQMRAIFMP